MDKARVLSKLDEIDGYLGELDAVIPETLEEYEGGIAVRRASERIIQIAIEAVIDVCSLLVKDLKLGVPKDEEDFIEKLSGKVLTKETAEKLNRYVDIDNARVYDILKTRLGDFQDFKKEVIEFVTKEGEREIN